MFDWFQHTASIYISLLIKRRAGFTNRLGRLRPIASEKQWPRHEQQQPLFLEIDHQGLYMRRNEPDY